jgi:hypothetical protein
MDESVQVWQAESYCLAVFELPTELEDPARLHRYTISPVPYIFSPDEGGGD